MRTLRASRFVKHQVGAFGVRPVHPLYPESQAFRYKFSSCLRNSNGGWTLIWHINLNQALLDQTGTHTSCAETLGIEYFLKLHNRSIAVRSARLIGSVCNRDLCHDR